MKACASADSKMSLFVAVLLGIFTGAEGVDGDAYFTGARVVLIEGAIVVGAAGFGGEIGRDVRCLLG